MENLNLCFEDALKKLETIVAKLERGEASLEDTLKYFEEGTALVGYCNTKLNEAELKVVQITEGIDGKPVEVEFQNEE